MTRMERHAIGCDADQQQQAGIDAGRHRQHRALFRQHGVQRDQWFAVGACERAELSVEPLELHRPRQCRQFSAKFAIDEDDARCIHPRQTCKRCAVARERRHQLEERRIGDRRAKAGILPRLLAPPRRGAGQTCPPERIGGRTTLARIARQSIAHCVEARKEAGDACLDDSSHDGSIPRNEHALSVMSGLVPAASCDDRWPARGWP